MKVFLWSLLILVLSWPVQAAGRLPIRFNRLTVNDGLSQGSVNCLVQDARGFMWFGTQDGLNRYDGYEIRIFKDRGLRDGFILALHMDREDRLWVGSKNGGLAMFDPWSERFAPVTDLGAASVRFIIDGPGKQLWLGTEMDLRPRPQIHRLLECQRFSSPVYAFPDVSGDSCSCLPAKTSRQECIC